MAIKLKKISYLVVSVLLLAGSALANSTENSTLKQADKLIAQGDFLAAYQLITPLEKTRTGEIEFDYALGVASIESGKVKQGLVALKRVLALDANYKNTNAEMNKAQLLLAGAEKTVDSEAAKSPVNALPEGGAYLKQANDLIRQGKFLEAYQLLEPLEAAHAGEINFDYLLGIAGVESGNVTRGEFALERVLALEPNHKDARAEIAKAHYLLGEIDASKAEFNNVLQQNPDEQTKRTIQKLLTSIDKLDGKTTTFGAYLEFGLGWDSNVSSAPSISSISLPAFGGISISLDKNAREKSDNFANIAAGISFRHPFNQQVAVFGSASSTNRINGSETPFDNSSLDFNAGLDYKINDNNGLTIALQDNHFDLDGEDFRHAYGASAQWLHNINAYNQIGAYGQFSRLKYAGSSIRNADRSIVGFNAGHVFQGDLKPVVYSSIYGGKENARSSIVNFLDQNIFGIRLGGQLSFNNYWQAFTSLAYEQRNHQAKDPVFLKDRQDRQYDVALGLRYSPARDWTIKPQISYSKNKSNINLNSYDRSLISVSVRKDFSW